MARPNIHEEHRDIECPPEHRRRHRQKRRRGKNADAKKSFFSQNGQTIGVCVGLVLLTIVVVLGAVYIPKLLRKTESTDSPDSSEPAAVTSQPRGSSSKPSLNGKKRAKKAKKKLTSGHSGASKTAVSATPTPAKPTGSTQDVAVESRAQVTGIVSSCALKDEEQKPRIGEESAFNTEPATSSPTETETEETMSDLTDGEKPYYPLIPDVYPWKGPKQFQADLVKFLQNNLKDADTFEQLQLFRVLSKIDDGCKVWEKLYQRRRNNNQNAGGSKRVRDSECCKKLEYVEKFLFIKYNNVWENGDVSMETKESLLLQIMIKKTLVYMECRKPLHLKEFQALEQKYNEVFGS